MKADGVVDKDIMATAATVIERRVNGSRCQRSHCPVIGQRSHHRRTPWRPLTPNKPSKRCAVRGWLEFIDTKGKFLNEGTIVRTSGNPEPKGTDPRSQETTLNPAGTQTNGIT
jgi:preprotein translocase subunit SecD